MLLTFVELLLRLIAEALRSLTELERALFCKDLPLEGKIFLFLKINDFPGDFVEPYF